MTGSRVPVCGECGHGHPGPPEVRACPDHAWTDACPYVGTACPPAEERERVAADLRSRMGAHLDDVFGGLLAELPAKPTIAKPGTYQDILEAMRKIAEMPPRRTEPIKLTPGQWAILPHGDPRAAPPYARPLGDLMGIPVVMVDSEAESTPVAEGWIKRKPWWVRLWRKIRGRS